MTPYIGCDTARELLQPFIDSELAMAEQVALEAHLRWCRTCRDRVEDIRLIGDSVRLASPSQVSDDEAATLAAIQAGVLARVRAEHDLSFGVRFARLFEDMHFMWPAMGATVALMLCALAITGINRTARAVDPDSMADRLDIISNPGSDRNPVQLDARMLVPGLVYDGPVLEAIPEEDATFALAAVVNREGRITNYELLQSERHDGEEHAAHEVSEVLDVVKRSRFTPAQSGSGPVAVNVVWVLARTTVKAPPLRAGMVVPLQPVPDVVVRPPSGEPAPPVLRPARS